MIFKKAIVYLSIFCSLMAPSFTMEQSCLAYQPVEQSARPGYLERKLSKGLPKDVYERISREQLVVINLPAYELNLYQKNGTDRLTLPIAIGKGIGEKGPTPEATGIIFEKRGRIIFRYGKGYPHLGIMKDDLIRWTNTYDVKGKPIGYRMPYGRMRGLGMRLWTGPGSIPTEKIVIHSTTDEYTVGSFSSKGCLRVSIDDMLELYGKIDLEHGPVPVIIRYNTFEVRGDKIIFHADIYREDKSAITSLEEALSGSGYSMGDLRVDALIEEHRRAQHQFRATIEKIIDIEEKSFPRHFIPDSVKKKLHKEYDIKDFLRQSP